MISRLVSFSLAVILAGSTAGGDATTLTFSTYSCWWLVLPRPSFLPEHPCRAMEVRRRGPDLDGEFGLTPFVAAVPQARDRHCRFDEMPAPRLRDGLYNPRGRFFSNSRAPVEVSG